MLNAVPSWRSIAAPPSSSTASPATFTRWERLLPHYRRSTDVAPGGRRHARVRLRGRAGRSCPLGSGLGAARHLAQPDVARAGDPPPALRPRGRRDAGMDVTWHDRADRRAGCRVAIVHDFRAGHPGPGRRSSTGGSRADRRPHAGDVRGLAEASIAGRRPSRIPSTAVDTRAGRSGSPASAWSPRSAPGATRSARACAPAAPRSSGSTASTRRRSARQVAAQIDDFDPLDHMDAAETARQLDRFSQFGLAAGPAGARPTPASSRARPAPRRRSGSGSTSARPWAASPSPRCSTSSTSSAASGRSRRPSRSPCSAAPRRPTSASRSTCAARSCRPPTRARRGAVALGEALNAIRDGEIDAAIAGGVEVPL